MLMSSLAEFTTIFSPYLKPLGWISLGMFIFSLLLVPVLVCKIPADYFVKTNYRPRATNKIEGIRYSLIYTVRNLAGIVLLLAGILMLLLPGQGLITIFLSLFVADFPGKRKVEERLVSIQTIHASINWIREKRGVELLSLPQAKTP